MFSVNTSINLPTLRKILGSSSLGSRSMGVDFQMVSFGMTKPCHQPGSATCCIGCDNTWFCMTGEVQSKFYLNRCKSCGRVYTEATYSSIKNMGKNYTLNNWQSSVPDACPLAFGCLWDDCPKCENWTKHYGAWIYAYPNSREIGDVKKHDLRCGRIIRSLDECRNDPKTSIIDPHYRQIKRPELVHVPGREPIYDFDDDLVVDTGIPVDDGWFFHEVSNRPPEIDLDLSFSCIPRYPVVPISVKVGDK